jgi:hypothetical protein
MIENFLNENNDNVDLSIIYDRYLKEALNTEPISDINDTSPDENEEYLDDNQDIDPVDFFKEKNVYTLNSKLWDELIDYLYENDINNIEVEINNVFDKTNSMMGVVIPKWLAEDDQGTSLSRAFFYGLLKYLKIKDKELIDFFKNDVSLDLDVIDFLKKEYFPKVVKIFGGKFYFLPFNNDVLHIIDWIYDFWEKQDAYEDDEEEDSKFFQNPFKKLWGG